MTLVLVQMGLVQLGVVKIEVDPKWQEMVEILKESRDAYKLSWISSSFIFTSHYADSSGLHQLAYYAFA